MKIRRTDFSRSVPFTPQGSWLERYFSQIGLDRSSLGIDHNTLAAIHRRQADTIPFDMLDCFLPGEPAMDFPDIVDKILLGNRGGGCTQLNELLACALETLGFAVRRGLSRVVDSATSLTPKTHKILIVELDQELWLCDVGYGMNGPLEPIRIACNEPSVQGIHRYRVPCVGDGEFELQRDTRQSWRTLYRFDLCSYRPEEFAPILFFNTRCSRSKFTRTLICACPRYDGGSILLNNVLTTRSGGDRRRKIARSPEELAQIVMEAFGIHLDVTMLGDLPFSFNQQEHAEAAEPNVRTA